MPNHFIQIIMDSCRYDTCLAANTPNMDRIGPLQRRWSYASWTAPSHYTFLMGMMPHLNPTQVFASEVYKQEYGLWAKRLGFRELALQNFLPQLSLPCVLRDLGYYCVARVSMPVLNPFTLLNTHFDDYRLMSNHQDFAGMLQDIHFPDDRPRYYLLNLGETHYPYMLKDKDLPIISGVHGVLKHISDAGLEKRTGSTSFFSSDIMEHLHQQQIECVEYIDGLLGELMTRCPINTWLTVTSDHGELFGENGFFGHGPIVHDKVFEVPFVEGMRP